MSNMQTFKMIHIPVHKKKRNVARVGEKYDKWKAAAYIVIKDIKIIASI